MAQAKPAALHNRHYHHLTMAKTTLLKKMSRGSARQPSIFIWLGLALILLLADQFTKVLIVGYYQLGDSTRLTDFFNIVRAHNTGAAFSFLASASGWQRWFFTAVGCAASIFIILLIRSHPSQKLFCFGLACILSGAIGNVVDRVRYGYVVDFLDFHLQGRHFPAFNLADSAITLGVICLIWDEILRVKKSRK